jgi:pimeloyl-ACP methyl ester carboxylesterase
MLAGALTAACGGDDSRRVPDETRFIDGTNVTEPLWVIRQDPPSSLAIVYVHGIFGDTIGTWTSENGVRFFDLVDAVPVISGRADTFVFGFPSAIFQEGSFDLREAANRLHLRLQHHGVLDYRQVVFVAHSLGGLVAMKMLLTHREIMGRVPLLVLFATPQEGAVIANIARHILNNPALSQLTEAQGNDLLRSLSDDWNAIAAASRPRIRCAYESQDTHGVRIVPWASATRFCEGAPPAIAADHLTIVKPASAASDAVAVVATALREVVLEGSGIDP